MENQNVSSELTRAAIVGGITGLRSTAGLRRIFNRSGLVKSFVLLEGVADKLPFVPARTQAPSLLGRAGFGGYAASLLAKDKRARLTCAAIGAVSAIVCTFAATQIRKKLGEKSRVTGTLLGFAEDGVVAWAERNLSAA